LLDETRSILLVQAHDQLQAFRVSAAVRTKVGMSENVTRLALIQRPD
jgi:hypothetical protein